MLAPEPGPVMGSGVPVAVAVPGGVPSPKTPPPVTIESIMKEARVPEDLIKEVLTHLNADGNTLPDHLACVSDEDFKEAAGAVKLHDQPLSGIQKGQVMFFVKLLRQAVDRSLAVAVPTPVALVAPSPPEGEKRKISEVLDQIDEASFSPLPPEKVAQMREFHRSVTGGDPPDHERPSAEQLGALSHRLGAGKAPFADFAVFGPYGRRQTKLLRFTAQVFVSGELVTRQLRGPGSYQGWRASWGVFRAAMIMLNCASPSTLDRYARGIEELVLLHPQAWGIISMADETMRAERWDILKEGLGALGTWEGVLASSAFGFENGCAHWWYLHVLGPLSSGSRQGATSTVATLEGLAPGSNTPALVHSGGGGSAQRGQGAGPRKRDRGGMKNAKWSSGSNGLPCTMFNTGTCPAGSSCEFAHVCTGCGGKFPFRSCWTCNPGSKRSKGAGKAGGSGKDSGSSKKRKGTRGSSGAPSAK